MIALPLGILAGLAGLLLLLIDNLRHFERLPETPEKATGRVSALVPARDEEAVIGDCLSSLSAQTDVELEIRVLDDASSDRTAAIVAAHAARDPRVTLMAGQPLPEGWMGKNHACHQLAEAATGEWLLFVDADVRLEAGAVASALALAERRGADLLSVFPEQEMGTWSEKLLLPMLGFVLLGFLPMRFLGGKDPRIAAANGQFMLFRREAYAAIAGHAGVKDAIVEDIALAREIKRAGLKLAIADGTGRVRCRMYRSLPEIWHGFSKNLYPAFGGKPIPFWFAMGLMGTLFVLPWLLLAGSPQRGLALASVLVGLTMRGMLAKRLRQPYWSVLGHPLAAVFLMGLGVRSFWVARSGRTVPWKGRSYGRLSILAFALFTALATSADPRSGFPGSSPAWGQEAASASHDPNYYAYATRYYLQYLSARDRGGRDAQDPYHFFHYYRYYQERYGHTRAETPGWFATMPFRTERTQAFARFVQKASPSVESSGAKR